MKAIIVNNITKSETTRRTNRTATITKHKITNVRKKITINVTDNTY